MSTWLLIFRSLRHYWRTHLGVVLGAMVSTAVLVGALAVGDSVRHTLRSVALARLGGIESAMDTGGRFFTENLAHALGTYISGAAPALRIRGIVAKGDGTARANNVQVLGVDRRFWSAGGFRAPVSKIANDQVVLNERLAAQLGVRAGDEVLLRVDKPSVLSRDAPLVPTEDASLAMRLTVAAVATDAQFGRFSLQANQVPPYNAFVSLALLQKKLELPGRVNLLLAGPGSAGNLDSLVGQLWRLADTGIEVRELTGTPVAELRSKRVFLEPAFAAAAEALSSRAPNPNQTILYRHFGVLTYFVNELRVGKKTTPYSTVTALGCVRGASLPKSAIQTVVPPDMGDDEVVITPWLAEDLDAKPGDELEMAYFVVGPTRKLVEQKSRFRIRAILPSPAPLSTGPDLMPDFPGVADVDNCRDWKPGIPIDLKQVRPKDEDYWKHYRGTPKAFITLAAGQKIWANRFGNLTAIRFFPGSAEPIRNAIREHLNPADFGLVFRPVREEALKASTQALDFGQLFLGLSFFLIAAAVLLMGLLFVFGIEQRAGQVGLLLALGFTPRRVRRLMLVEGGLLALVGGAIGTLAGTLYTRGVLAALSGVWSGAVAGSAVQYHAETSTLLMGGGIGVVVALAAMWLTLRRQAKRPARELLTGSGVGWQVLGVGGKTKQGNRKPRRLAPWIGLVSIAAAIAIVVAMGARRDQAAAMGFFSAGALLLIGGIALCYTILSPAGAKSEARNPKSETNANDQSPKHKTKEGQGGGSSRDVSGIGASSFELVSDFGFRYSDFRLRTLGWRNATRRRGRSLAVVALLACASFLVFAVGANRKDPLSNAAERSSGTGGFAFYGETAMPIFDDLNSPEGRKAYNLDPETMKDVEVVPLRVHEGDDASCLNLNRAQQPRLLGVRPADLARRGAFSFVKCLPPPESRSRWVLEGDTFIREDVWFRREPWPLLDARRRHVTYTLRVESLGMDGAKQVAFELARDAAKPAPDHTLFGPDVVPAVGDEATVTWGLGKKVGDTLEYTDSRGQPFKVLIVGVIANSILQGSLLIAEDQFIRLFPSDEGYRAFLVDAPDFWSGLHVTTEGNVEGMAGDPDRDPFGALSQGLQDVGLELTPTVRRLAEFGTVENTYLSIFQALGGLAMLLGSVGLGIVVLRNVMERRNELALLRAVGFRKRALEWLVLSEHWGLLALGLLVGTVSAVIAVLPALRSPGADVPYLSLIITLVAVAASGLLWTWLAALAALRGPLLNALRNE